MADELLDSMNRTQMFYMQKIENSFKNVSQDQDSSENFFKIQVFGIKAAEGLSVSGFNVH